MKLNISENETKSILNSRGFNIFDSEDCIDSTKIVEIYEHEELSLPSIVKMSGIIFRDENKSDDDVLNEIVNLLDSNRETVAFCSELSAIDREITLWNRRVE